MKSNMWRCRAEKERRISEIINSTSRFSSNLLFSGKKRIYLEVWEIWGKFWLVKNSFWSHNIEHEMKGSRKHKGKVSLIQTS